MPYRQWTSGDELTAADINVVGNQVVGRFTDAAARAVLASSPIVGQVSALDNHPGALWVWNGSAWVEPTPYTQAGNSVIVTDSNGNGSIVYPRPFLGHENAVSLTPGGGGGGVSDPIYVCQVLEGQNLSNLVNFQVRSLPSGAAVVGSVRVLWTAVGTRAPT
jgi:hypothetical protein